MKWETVSRRYRGEYSGSSHIVVQGHRLGVSWSLIGRSWSCRWSVWCVWPESLEFEPYYCLARGTADSIEDARRAAIAVAVELGLLTAHNVAELAR